MKQARIYSPIQSPMQSGKSFKKEWILEFIKENSLTINPIMGCSGSRSTDAQPKLVFESETDAINYANLNNIKYELIKPLAETIKVKAYTDNFKY